MSPVGVEAPKKISCARRWFLRTALAYLGTPYVWAGDDPTGFDCSGLVLECLKSAGLIADQTDMTAAALWRQYRNHAIPAPCAGALLFTFSANDGLATHVAICLDSHFQIAAAGGDARIDSVDRAWERNAWVRIRPIGVLEESRKLVDPFVAHKD